MKFLALTTLASVAYAGVLVQRDLALIKTVMSSTGNGLDGLNTAFQGFSGDPAPLLDASNKLISTVKDGKAQVDPSSDLTLADALGLQAPAQELQKKGDALLASLKAAVPNIEKNGLCEVTYAQASDINTNSKALIDSIVSKVPQSAQGIAQGIVAGLIKDLDEAQAAVSPDNCKNSGPAPGSSAATSAAPPTATSAAPPATSDAPPATSAAPPTTSAAPPVTTAAPPASDTCPAASTVTVTAVDSKDCTPTPVCTKKPPVTVTTTKKACPTKTNLPW